MDWGFEFRADGVGDGFGVDLRGCDGVFDLRVVVNDDGALDCEDEDENEGEDTAAE